MMHKIFSLFITLFVLSTLLTSGLSNDDFCTNPKIKEAMQNIRAHIKKLNLPETRTEKVLKEVEESFKDFVYKYERLMSNCSSEDKQNTEAAVEFFENINNINECVMSIVKGDLEGAKKAIEKVTDDHLLQLMVTIYCANETDCSAMLQLANVLENKYASIHIYQALDNMLEMSRMNTTIRFINKILKLQKKQEQSNITEALQCLLKRAIKTELKSNYASVQTLYKIDSNLTYQIVQELINDIIDSDVGSYEIFQLVQRSPNITMWMKYLKTILEKLEEKQKINSVLGAELVREIKLLEKINVKINETELTALEELKNVIPTFVEKLLQGEICSDISIVDNLQPEDPKDTKVFISSKQDGVYKRVKLIPEREGPLAIVNVPIEQANMTLILDNFDHGGQIVWNNNTVPVIEVTMETLPDSDFCQMTNFSQFVCAPAELILSTITNSPYNDLNIVKQFYEYYHNSKNSCSRE